MNVMTVIERCGRAFTLLNLKELKEAGSSRQALEMVATSSVGFCFLDTSDFLWGRILVSAMKMRSI